jgi:hypothetical protein
MTSSFVGRVYSKAGYGGRAGTQRAAGTFYYSKSMQPVQPNFFFISILLILFILSDIYNGWLFYSSS